MSWRCCGRQAHSLDAAAWLLELRFLGSVYIGSAVLGLALRFMGPNH